MPDFLDNLARDAKETIQIGYYDILPPQIDSNITSLRKAIVQNPDVSIITEVKKASPSAGTIRKNIEPKEIALSMKRGGAVGISVLTEPKNFNGSLSYLAQVRESINTPILMKDFIISAKQIEAAQKIGANAILLIQTLFDRGYCELCLDEMIEYAHSRKLEVLLETRNENEFQRAVESKAELIGINNRNLGNLKVDLNVTTYILNRNDNKGKIVVSESGIKSAADVVFLRKSGAKAFLVGSAIMMADNVESKVRDLVQAK